MYIYTYTLYIQSRSPNGKLFAWPKSHVSYRTYFRGPPCIFCLLSAWKSEQKREFLPICADVRESTLDGTHIRVVREFEDRSFRSVMYKEPENGWKWVRSAQKVYMGTCQTSFQWSLEETSIDQTNQLGSWLPAARKHFSRQMSRGECLCRTLHKHMGPIYVSYCIYLYIYTCVNIYCKTPPRKTQFKRWIFGLRDTRSCVETGARDRTTGADRWISLHSKSWPPTGNPPPPPPPLPKLLFWYICPLYNAIC